jgi:glycine cleavage system aminomethyltransferase T
MTERYDMRWIQRGGRLRRSPYFDATWRAGCRSYTVYNHTLLPSYYRDPVEEYWHLVRHVAIWDVGVERQVEISGPDAVAFAELLTPRDLSSCEVGQGKYVTIGAPDGGIVNDPVLLRLDRDRFWLSAADSDLLLYAKGVAAFRGLDVSVREPDVWPLQVQGPKSKPLIADLFGEDTAEMGYYHFRTGELGGIPVLVTRTGWTGEIGYELYLQDARQGDPLWKAVMRAGKKYRIRPTGPSDIRRVEAGILNYGADMTLENNPFEVGLDRLVNLHKKANFLGKEALSRIQSAGVERRLVGITIRGTPLEFNMTKWPVRSDGEQVGQVTSAIHSPRLRANIGYAMVPVAYSNVGTELSVDSPRGRRRATVVPKPFVDPAKSIPKS